MAIVWVSIFWLAGILAGQQIPLLTIHWLALTCVCLIAAGVLRKHTTQRGFFVLLAIFTFGSLRAQRSIADLDQGDLGYYNDLDAQARVTGIVIDDPVRRDGHAVLRVRAERLIIPALEIARTIDGDVLVHTNRDETWSYGDWVRIEGTLETPPQIDDFSYRDHLARKGVYSWAPQAYVLKLGEGRGNPIMHWIFLLRSRLYVTVGMLFPEPEASLVAGILLGIESDIPNAVYEDFNRTGTTHIIAISGFNITLIANLIVASSRRFFGERRGLWVAGAGITLYTILVGADAAVVRAAVMGGLALLARLWGRESLALASLGASSFVMTLISPTVLMDVGFQLSFAATLGLILYAKPLHDWTVKTLGRWLPHQNASKYGGLMAEYLLYTLAAQVTTWPLTMYYFRRFSFISLLVNPIILPLQPALMILSGAATLSGAIWLPLGRFFALAAWPFPALTIRIVSTFSSLATGGFGLSGVSLLTLISYYFCLLSIPILMHKLHSLERTMERFQSFLSGMNRRAAWILALAAVTTCFIWQSAAHSADSLLHLYFFDVGMGDAILIQSPSGERVLINGGPSPSKLLNSLGRELPLVGRKLTAVIMAGTRTNQTAGLVGLANHIQIENVFLPPARGSYTFRRAKEGFLAANVANHEIISGQKIEIGGGAFIEPIACGDSGITLLVTFDNARILIPAGLATEQIEDLLTDQRVHDVSVLLLHDGGHPSANPRQWLLTTNATVVLLSVSSTAGVDRPSKEVLANLQGRRILRTDQHGSIVLHTNGEELWVETERVSTR